MNRTDSNVISRQEAIDAVHMYDDDEDAILPKWSRNKPADQFGAFMGNIYLISYLKVDPKLFWDLHPLNTTNGQTARELFEAAFEQISRVRDELVKWVAEREAK